MTETMAKESKSLAAFPNIVTVGSGFAGTYAMTRGIGRGLPGNPTFAVVVPAYNRMDLVSSGELDLGWTIPKIVATWAYEGRVEYAGKPLRNIRGIARFPQNDKHMIALAPESGIESLEQIGAEKRPIRVAVRESDETFVMENAVFRQYGYTTDDLVRWGGRVWTVGSRFDDVKPGDADLVIGEACTQPVWKALAGYGFRFIGISEEAAKGLERDGFERNVTPAGFLPGIDRPLLSVDESDFLLVTREEADDDFIYAVARKVDQDRRRIEEGAVGVEYVYNEALPIPNLTHSSPLTGPISRQWEMQVPLHAGAERYYREAGHIK